MRVKMWLYKKLGRCCAISPEGIICAKPYGHNQINQMSLHVGSDKNYGFAWGSLFEEE